MTAGSLRLYWRYVDISLRSQMQYPASFALRTFAHFLVTGAEFLGFVALFQRFSQIRGWDLPHMALFYGIIAVAFAIAEAAARGFDIFPQLIKGATSTGFSSVRDPLSFRSWARSFSSCGLEDGARD